MWCLPKGPSAEFVSRMEDVLGVYHRPYDASRPVVCLDETTKQLVGETRAPMPPAPGRPAHIDHHYRRNGTASLFLWIEPLTGRTHVDVRERHARSDLAHVLRDLVDTHYPHAPRVTVVLDNLVTHTEASLYQAFAPTEARRIAQRLDLRHTPKHGSWLNIAEIGLSVLSRQCLKRRIATMAKLKREIRHWLDSHDQHLRPINWQFNLDNARTRLQRLYPTILA
jgi:hypothetical protein